MSDYIDTRQLIQTQLVAIETDEDQLHRAFLTCWASSGKTRRVRLADISRSGSIPLSLGACGETGREESGKGCALKK